MSGFINYTRVPDKGRAVASISLNASFNQAMSVSIAGTVFYAERMKGYSICAAIHETSAALAGTLKLQASNNAFTDNTDLINNPAAVWVDIPTSPITLTSGDTQVFWNHDAVFYESVRVVWTSTSGQGTFTPYFLGKG